MPMQDESQAGRDHENRPGAAPTQVPPVENPDQEIQAGRDHPHPADRSAVHDAPGARGAGAVDVGGAAGSHPQIASFPNGELVVAWDEPVQVNNKYFKRIAVQKRSAAGKSEQQSVITADTLTASYPVVASISKTNSVIAYLVKKDKKDYIMYQRVKL